jgi:hypothetical protein
MSDIELAVHILKDVGRLLFGKDHNSLMWSDVYYRDGNSFPINYKLQVSWWSYKRNTFDLYAYMDITTYELRIIGKCGVQAEQDLASMDLAHPKSLTRAKLRALIKEANARLCDRKSTPISG